MYKGDGESMLRKLIQQENGNSLALVGILFTIFVGFTAMVTDLGLLYVTRAQLGVAVDAGALAGVQELPRFPDRALEKAKEYAINNGANEESLVITISDDNRLINVYARKEVNFLFATILGLSSSNVSNESTASIFPVSSVDSAVPLGIGDFEFEFGETYTLKFGADGGVEGWRGILQLTGPGARNYETDLAHGFNGTLRVGDILTVETGNISNPTKRAIDYRIGQCTDGCTVENFDRDCPRILKIPVIEQVDHRSVKILGFAAFLVDEVEGQGNESIIQGEFIETISPGEADLDGTYYGILGSKLIK